MSWFREWRKRRQLRKRYWRLFWFFGDAEIAGRLSKPSPPETPPAPPAKTSGPTR